MEPTDSCSWKMLLVVIKPSRLTLGPLELYLSSRHLKFFLTLFPFDSHLLPLHNGLCGAGADSALVGLGEGM